MRLNRPVAHAQRAPQVLGFRILIMPSYLLFAKRLDISDH
jgi:hypothetical protein